MPLTQVAWNPTPCLILNPRSFRASSGTLAVRAQQVAMECGADLIVADTPEVLAAAVDACLAGGPRRIAVLAGDGTVQALVEHLAQRDAQLPQPALVILGGGRTNLIAGDFDGRGRLIDKLRAALSWTAEEARARSEFRHLLSVEQAPAPPRRGFFLAAALVDSVIRECHAYRAASRSALCTGHTSTPVGLLRLVALSLLGRSPLPPLPELDLRAAGVGRLHGAMRILIATTLQHRKGLFCPYGGPGAGALRFTAIAANARRFWLRLPSILVGRFGARMQPPDGYLTGSCDEVEVRGLRYYALDGEKFEADPSRPVLLRSGPPLLFLRP